MFKSTVYTILGILAMEPMSGYEIKKTIDESIHFFWNESQGQIYPALKQAVEAHLIKIEETAGARGKTIYSINQEGREVLDEWLQQSPTKLTQRNELLLKVFFGNNTNPEIISEHMISNLLNMRQKLRIYQGIEQKLLEHLAQKVAGAKYWIVTVRYGIKSLEASISWAEESIKFLASN